MTDRSSQYTVRVTGFEWVPASSLLPHPKNWRHHPAAQREALHGILSQIGVADAALVYRSERENGALVVIDGHLRQDMLEEVPVLITDLTDEEAEVLLASYDTIGLMGLPDVAAVSALMVRARQIGVQDAALETALESFARRHGVYDPEQRLSADGDEGDAENDEPLLFDAVRSVPSVEYRPTTDPMIADMEVDERAVAAAAAKLEEQYKRERKLELVICPACDEEFYVDA